MPGGGGGIALYVALKWPQDHMGPLLDYTTTPFGTNPKP